MTATPASASFLVVDDDEKSRRLACDVLEHAGYATTRAASGEEALALARGALHDGVLLDIRLPGVDGVQTVAALRALPGWAHVPVIAMTALGMPDERPGLLPAGFDGFVPKPLRIKELVGLVAKLLVHPR